MKSKCNLLFTAALLAASAVAAPRPLVIEESQWLEPPREGLSFFAESVAIDGNWALATALHSEDGSFNYPYQQLALLYRRSGATWVFDKVLVADDATEDTWNYPKVAMKNGIAAFSASPLRAFRLTPRGWTALPQPFPSDPANPAWANGVTRIDGRTLAAISGGCSYGAVTRELTGAAWGPQRQVPADPDFCNTSSFATVLDIQGNRMVLARPQEDMESPASRTLIYTRAAPNAPWEPAGDVPAPEWGYGVALNGNDLIVGSWHPLGNMVYRRNASGWDQAGHLPTLTGYGIYHDGAAHIGKGSGLLLIPTMLHDGQPGGISVYRRENDGRYQHVAQLVSSTGDSLGPVAEISGRTVVVGGVAQDSFDHGRLYVFELPESLVTPDPQQDDFEDGESRWFEQSGDFAVTQRGPTRVYRQTSLVGAARAVFMPAYWTNQSLQVDLRPTSFSGADRWVGMATRYADASNHYRVLLRSSGKLQLQRVQAGVVETLASAPLTVGTNRRYRVRLESIGTRHRVFINGVAALDARDAELSAGRVALLTYSAAADFDNVVLSPTPRALLYENDLHGSQCANFTHETGLRVLGAPQWDCDEEEYLRQLSDTGMAGAAVGPVTGDQSVETRLQLEGFAEGGEPDHLLGVTTRVVDADNLYAFVLRSSKDMALLKRVNGQWTVLGTADFQLPSDVWHTLRLDAVGDRLRAYINGQLLIQARDATLREGVSGVVTNRATVRFDYLRVIQP